MDYWLDKLIQDYEIFEQENLKFKEEIERRRYEREKRIGLNLSDKTQRELDKRI